MSAIHFLASSKALIFPEETDGHHIDGIYDTDTEFSVMETDKEWQEIVQQIFSMPYIYETSGLGSPCFLIYLDKYMDIGDVMELYTMPVQHWHEEYIGRVLEKPEPISVNVGRYTYENKYGLFRLNPKKWQEELSHRTLVTDRGVTTIVKYP